MSKVNQSQIKDLFISTVAVAAQIGKADGNKIIYIRETGLWYSPASGSPTVDGVKHVAGAGTVWSAINTTPSFPANSWATGQVYNIGQMVTLPGGTIAWCNTKHTSTTAVADSAKWEPVSQVSTKQNYFQTASQAYADPFTYFYVSGALYFATKAFVTGDTLTVKGNSCVPVAPSQRAQSWLQGWNYPFGTVVQYQGVAYRAAMNITNAGSSPLINNASSNQLIPDFSIPQGAMIVASNGALENPMTGKLYVHPDQRLTVTNNTVYRYYVGTLTTEFTEIHSNVTSCKILNANFHVETFLGESRDTGTKAYEEFVSHNNSSDESRVRVILDGTSLKIQQGTNVKITGGYVDFEGVVSGHQTFADVGMRKAIVM